MTAVDCKRLEMEDRQNISETVGGGTITKVDRYHWVSRNRKGELAYVDKRLIHVDRRYQRDLNNRKRQRIASNFNWSAFGTLSVARRRDGSLWILDGQHRLEAAMSRADVQDVPVVIYDLAGEIRDEATDFIVANKERKALTGVETFRAMVTSGDSIACEIETLAASIGRKVGHAGPKSIACPMAVYKCLQNDASALRRVWPVIGELCEGCQIGNHVVLAIYWVERKLLSSSGARISLAETSALRRRLLDTGIVEIERAMAESAMYYQRGGETVWARGVLKVLNHRCKNKCSLAGEKVDG